MISDSENLKELVEAIRFEIEHCHPSVTRDQLADAIMHAVEVTERHMNANPTHKE